MDCRPRAGIGWFEIVVGGGLRYVEGWLSDW